MPQPCRQGAYRRLPAG